MARFNPLAEFVSGQSSALGLQSQRQGIARETAAAPVRNQLAQIQLQQAQTGQQREGQEFDQAQALKKARIINNIGRALKGININDRQSAVDSIVKNIDPSFSITRETFNNRLTDEQLDIGIAGTQSVIDDPSKLTTAQREFQASTKGFSEQDVAKTRRIKAGLDPRAVGSAVQTISSKGIAGDIAKTEGTIAEGKEFGKLTGSSRAKAIDSGFDKIVAINKNIENIDRAIEQIDLGADTGAIESRFFPSIKASTVALEQIQSELALDVVGATTFGALSQGELDLAKQVALPTRLDSAELKQFLIDKKSAQTKLMAYFQEQIDFMDQGGTKAGFLRSKSRGQSQKQKDFTSSSGIQFTVE